MEQAPDIRMIAALRRGTRRDKITEIAISKDAAGTPSAEAGSAGLKIKYETSLIVMGSI